MPESYPGRTRDNQIIVIRFRVKATADEVVARLLESVRRTDLFLLAVLGDGQRVYPFVGRKPALSASTWRAELFWRRDAPTNRGWHLEVFVHRAERFLECFGGVRLELGGGQRNLPEEVVG